MSAHASAEPGMATSLRALNPLAVTFEDHTWPQRPERGPYAAAITPALATLDTGVLGLGLKTLARADRASTEMTRLDTVLAAQPIAAVLTYVDAVASSRMEGITADTLDTVLAVVRPGTDAAANRIAANLATTTEVLTTGANADTVLAAHRTLLAGLTHENPGRWRETQVWIGSFMSTPHSASFVPPHPDRVPAAIDDWAAFCARTDIPALAHAATAHAQYETIHPFADCNGRTGRSLVHTMLHAAGLTSTVIPISAGLATDKRRYVDALIAFRDGDAEPIVEVFTDATEIAVDLTHTLVEDMTEVLTRWQATSTARAGSAAEALLPVLLGHPVVDSRSVRRLVGISQPAADAALHRLEDDGVLTRPTEQRRNMVWVASDVVEVLDRFNVRRS